MGRNPQASLVRYFQRKVALGDVSHYYYRTKPGSQRLEVSFGPTSNWFPSYLALPTILDRLHVTEITEEQCPSRNNDIGYVIDLNGVQHGT